MANTTPTPIDAKIAPTENGAPAMATQITPPSSVTNGHTSPIGAEYGDGATPADLNASITGKGDGKGGWTPGFRAQTSPEKALKWERHFTQPGQDAFDTIDWEMRTAGITGEDGKSVFEQTDCEIPKTWSQLATNVVVSKYFRGPINSPQRETSVKQVIGRVADTIGVWGAEGGYFASDEDAESFRDELAYLLVHQYGAFNSPVWFNLGVKDAKQQCSACQPYDALVSTPAGLIPIGELVEKNAVGHAVYDANGVARIVAVKHNGRKEVTRLHLKSGYTLDVTADHLVWKRVSHAKGRPTGKWVEAGTLKANDTLAWHRTAVVDKSQELPAEVAEAALAGWLQSDGFVGRYETGTNKSLTIEAMTVNDAEEKWVRAALDAVFPDAHSHTRAVVTQDEKLDCQRIRIYGDFMEPFIEKWDLMTRGNAMTVPPMLYTAPLPVVVAYLRSLFQAEGYVSVRTNARIAFDMVSEGIVRGVQSLLGRLGIYARVRFKADARADRQGCWCLSIYSRGDRELFAQEIGFIAPDKQAKVIESLRLAGHAVSDVKTMQIERIEARGEMDVYDIQTTSGEYLSNGIRVHNCFINDVYDDMESIMELAATEARLFKGGSGAGVNLWRIRSSKEQLRGGGIASGPISFMRGWDAFAGAVKCLTPDAQVYTDGGVKTVGELISPDLAPGFHADDSVVLATKDGMARISQVYVSPLAPTREMELAHTGLRLRGTHQHPVLTLTPQFELEWKALSQIQTGDRVAVARGQEMWPEAAPTFDFEPQLTWAKKDLSFPTQMTPELARLLGYMTSEGCMDAERFRFCNADEDVFADFLRCVETVFETETTRNVSERVHPKTGVTTQMFEACWSNAVRFLQCAGLGFELLGEKRVPASVMSSPRDLVVEFLRAYFEGDAHVSTHVCASSASRELLSDVQLLLLNMGMLPLLRRHPVAGKDGWNLYLRGEAAFRFVREVGFISARKQAMSDVAGDKNTNIDTLPFLVDVLRARAGTNGNYACPDGTRRLFHFGFFNRKAGSAISYNRLRNTPALLDSLEQIEPQWAQTLEWLMEREFFWDTVKSVEEAAPAVTYDFTVPETHSFVANGIVNHNSGGTCLAPYQRVYTAQGPVPVMELAEREEFVALSFDPPANRYKAKRARAWLAGQKEVVRVTTDKGAFELSFDHPVKLSSGEYVQAGSLAEGMSLFACTIDTQHGHLRVGLRDGKKGKEFLHRLVAADVMNEDLDGLVVHHRDGDRLNNAPENLQVMTQADHAALHGREVAARGEHIFQTQEFSHAGADNGMHRDGAFWGSEAADAYRETQGQILKESGRAGEMQHEAARQKTLNTAFRVLNAGWQIDTFAGYVHGRKAVVGRIPSIVGLREQIETEFGSHEEFVREVARANHRVQSVEVVGKMDVYDVEVECPTADDKSPQTGHNFLIWDGDEPTGSGVVVANTRRAAKMVILNVDHPDIGEFITCKADEEKKAWALIEAGYDGGFNMPGGAYDSVDFQNANHSVRVTDEFMRAAENNGDWNLRAVTTGKVIETRKAREMLKDIAQTTWICGDPGMQFDTIINDWHTCANTDRIYASNPCCVTGDTLVGVADGRNAVAIRDLVGSEVPVYAHDHATGRTTISRMWNIEVKRHDVPVFRVTLDDGSSFRATDDHLIMLRDGSYRMVRDLKADDSLMPFHSKHQKVWDGAQWSDDLNELADVSAVAGEILATPVERCCPICRDNFATDNPASLFCSQSCRASPMGREMSGQTTRALNAMLNDNFSASDALRAARLLLDSGVEPAFANWGDQRQVAAELGATRVPTEAQLPNLFDNETAFREGAALWNHKVVAVEFDGQQDVYDGTVDTHHNFAILTSAEQSREVSAQNFSGIFIHNSEFMFLNSTACNLASLNLLKFYDMETGVFDAQAYSRACETFLTAQEIIVSFASYPTEKIGEMSEQYRPLGLGYANLGALLMAKGLAYDSDEGRALAGALTAIMTGAGYRKSAQIARNTGPFEGYADNKEPMLRVIAKHRDAVNQIDATLVAENVMQEARNVWDDAYMTGQKYGYRNSQVSVLAPTGTISFMMDCDTTGVEPDIALVKYKKLVGGGLLKIVNQTVPAALRNLGYDEGEIKSIVEYIDKNDTIEGAPGLDDEHLSVFDCAFKAMNGTRSIHHMGHIKMMAATQPFISGAISKCVTGETLIATAQGIVPIASFYRGEKPGEFTPLQATLASIGAPQDADLFYYGGNRPTVKATWADGRSIEGTPNHRVKVANASGYDWKRLDALEAGDFVGVKLGANLWANEDADLLKGFAPSALYGCQKAIVLPPKMTPNLARFLGMYIAEGNMTRTNYMVRVTNLNADVLAACERIASQTFGITGRVETDKRNGVTSWVCASKSLCEFLTHIGAGGDSSSKQIPWSVLQSGEECVREFVGGLWLDGYVRNDGMTAICLKSPELLRQLQVVLNNFGLRAQLIRKYNKPYDKYFHELGLHGADSRRFSELFRLDDAHKTEALAKLCGIAKKMDAVHSDVIPAFRAEIQALVRAHHDTARFRNVFDPRTKHLSRHTVQTVAEFYGEELLAAIPDLREILDNNIHFVALRGEVEEGFAPVYDFQVPTNHAFLGNGLINHNTVNMPQDCTADEIYDAYLQSWKLGVKAVAIYRDGSKRTQPLSTASDAQKAEKAEKKEGEIRRAARRKLPDERNSITHKFSIAGQEGYFMVGLYQDGSPGEIFIKMSKEGSTISGLMDSFAVAVSMCLQYGVPLRVLVNKFSHTRFEPSGYTTNRDIPIAKSLMDYIFRWFDLKFHPNGDNGHLNKVEAAAPAELPAASLFEPSDNNGNVGNAQREVSQMQQDAPPCPDCGALTVRSGACYKCNECGATTGCG